MERSSAAVVCVSGRVSRCPASTPSLPLELVTAEGVVEVVEHVGGAFAVLADRPEPAGELLAVEDGRFDGGQGREGPGSSTATSPAASTVPVRNPMLDRWPSPMPRTLMTKRTEPTGAEDWSGWATMLGLHSDAASMEYSWVKVAPSRSQRSGLSSASGSSRLAIRSAWWLKVLTQVSVAVAEPSDEIGELALHVVLVEGEDPGDDAWTLVIRSRRRPPGRRRTAGRRPERRRARAAARGV